MGQKVIIEDLQPGKTSNGNDYSTESMKIYIKAQHKLSALVPRDATVWTKTDIERKELKKAKMQHKVLMLSNYPEYTNKSDFYTQKALIWN